MRSRLLLLLAMLAGAASAETYDFAYTATGDPRLTPLQVFDNGKQTWLQLPQLKPQPAIFAVTAAGDVMLPARPEGQMLIIDRVEQQLAIVLGRVRANVRYVGVGRRENDAAMFGKAGPAKVSGSAPAPVPAATILGTHKVPMTTATDVAPPVSTQADAAAPKGNTAGAAPDLAKKGDAVKSWTLTEGHMIGADLADWAKSADWNVVWNLHKDWVVPASTTFTGDFKAAATNVINTLAANGVLIRAQFYDGNKTLVVTGPGVAAQ